MFFQDFFICIQYFINGKICYGYIHDSNDYDLILSSEILIPLSLILSELTINSIKYAFDGFDVDEKVIKVSVDRFGKNL